MNWKEIYQEKLMSAEEAIRLIHDGNRISFANGMGEAPAIVDALEADYQKFHDVEIVFMQGIGECHYLDEKMQGHFIHNSLFVGPGTRSAVEAARAEYTPCYFSKIPSLFYDNILPLDVAVICVSPPDKHGFCSFGVSVDYNVAAIRCAKRVIAQVNDQMPRTHGECFVHVSQMDAIVEQNQPIRTIPKPLLTDIEKAIGKNCASLINDGDTLQLGIGLLPDAVLLFLKNKNDLGIHTEMFSDGVVDLFEEGVITNKRKNFNTDKMVASFVMGTKKLYDFVDDNPSVMMMPIDYVANPNNIGQNDNMVSINACIQVDLMGQVNSESLGLRQISGVGGQVDFVRGAALSKGGRSIIALPSKVTGKPLSKIVPFLDPGAAVTTNRNDVHYIITEYGIACMRGKTLSERGRALINIAHPDFRPQLIEEWERRFKRIF